MSDQSYAPPKSNLSAMSAGDIDDILEPLIQSKPWVRFLSIMGFIFAAVMVLVGLAVIAGGSAINTALAGSAAASIGNFLGYFYFFLAVLYLVPSYYLFRSASAIGVAMSTRTKSDIALALKFQKSLWKFAGIMMIIMIVLMIVPFIMGIIAAVSLA